MFKLTLRSNNWEPTCMLLLAFPALISTTLCRACMIMAGKEWVRTAYFPTSELWWCKWQRPLPPKYRVHPSNSYVASLVQLKKGNSYVASLVSWRKVTICKQMGSFNWKKPRWDTEPKRRHISWDFSFLTNDRFEEFRRKNFTLLKPKAASLETGSVLSLTKQLKSYGSIL